MLRNLVYDTAGHLEMVRFLGACEHKWKHRRGQGDPSFVSIIVDLTPVLTGPGAARLRHRVRGWSAAAVSNWRVARTPAFRAQVEVVARDGFAGYHRAAAEPLPVTTVSGQFHVVHLAAQKLTRCRQRVQQDT